MQTQFARFFSLWLQMGNWWQSESASVFPRSARWFSLRIHCCPIRCEARKGGNRVAYRQTHSIWFTIQDGGCSGVMRSLPFCLYSPLWFRLADLLGFFRLWQVLKIDLWGWLSQCSNPPTATLSITLEESQPGGTRVELVCTCVYVLVFLRVRYS